MKAKAWLMRKWNIQTDRDFWLIMLTYSLAGMAIMPVKKMIFHAIGVDHSPWWVIVLVYIPLIPPVYQINLICIGTIFGQKNFVLGQARKRIDMITRRFKRA